MAGHRGWAGGLILFDTDFTDHTDGFCAGKIKAL
jgi:hypothetical protein